MWHKDKNNFNTICNLSDIFTKIYSKRHYTIYDIYSYIGFDKKWRLTNYRIVDKPARLERILGTDLPKVADAYDVENNFDRGTSGWNCVTYHFDFVEPLSEAQIKALDGLCEKKGDYWSKGDAGELYRYSNADDEMCLISCEVYSSHALLTFESDEDAGLGVIFMLVLSAYALLIWGAVLVVVALIRKLLHKK